MNYKRIFFNVILYFFVIVVFISCAKDPVKPGDPTPLGDTTLKDLSYSGNAANKMDLYLPGGRTAATKTIILIHGGGWNSGDKSELSFFAVGWQKSGFAVANINYRWATLDNPDNYTMQMNDIDAATTFLTANANSYHINASTFYITGHSAGAHLSLAYAYTRGAAKIKAAAGMATPTNLFTATQDNPLVALSTIVPFTGSFLNDISAPRYKDWSPYYHVSSATVPTILFQGEADIVVFKNQSQQLKTVLNNNNVPNKLIMYPGIYHDWWADGNLVNNTLDETVAWFNKY